MGRVVSARTGIETLRARRAARPLAFATPSTEIQNKRARVRTFSPGQSSKWGLEGWQTSSRSRRISPAIAGSSMSVSTCRCCGFTAARLRASCASHASRSLTAIRSINEVSRRRRCASSCWSRRSEERSVSRSAVMAQSRLTSKRHTHRASSLFVEVGGYGSSLRAAPPRERRERREIQRGATA